MIERQKSFVNYLEQLAVLLDVSDLKSDPQLIDRVSQTELLVPVIGAFSAGKSSLLNALLGQEILPVGLAPETELATELRYSPESYLMAIHLDGREERLPVEAINGINQRAKELSRLELYIDSPALKRIAPLILVDMPGYGSSLEGHNNAIAFYLPRGVHFVVVTSIEDGSLTQSMIRRLDEVKIYGGDFTFVLSKCNLRPATQIEQVRNYIDEQLQVYFEDDHKTLPVGKDGVDAFAQSLEKIDANFLFDKLFIEILKNQHNDLVRNINIATSAVKNDEGRNEQELHALEQALAKLKAQHVYTQEQIRERYSSRLLSRCMKGVDEDLNQATEELTSTLASTPNGSRLNNAISEIIRNSLTRNIQREINDISTIMIDDLAAELATVSENFSELGISDDWVDELSMRVKDSLEKTNQMLGNWSTQISERNAQKEQVERVYKGLSVALAVTTSVVAPILELAIIFLPDILRMLKSGNERQILSNKLQMEIYPGIKAELRNRLPGILHEQVTMMLTKVNQSFDEQISCQMSIIAAHSRQSEKSKAEVEAQLAILEKLTNAVKTLASQYLYQ